MNGPSETAALFAKWRAWKQSHPEFPLSVHATGRWYVRIRGRNHYFGRLDEPRQYALELWIGEKDYLLAGVEPPAEPGLTMQRLTEAFLEAKGQMAAAGELAPRSLADYRATCQRVLESFGTVRAPESLGAADFNRLRADLAKTRSPGTLGNEINRVRILFRWAYDAGLIDRPTRWGPDFRRPAKRIMRQHRASRPKKMFEAAEIRDMLKHARPTMRAMILLGVNCGYNNADVGRFPMAAAKLAIETGWLDVPRGKTGVDRLAKLWPETVEALKTAILWRPKPKTVEARRLAFVTRHGGAWHKDTAENPLTTQFIRLARKLGHHRSGVGFGALRHTFATIAGESLDQVAVNVVMGHADNSMAAQYRERITDARIEAVCDLVRNWLAPWEVDQ